MTTAAAAAPSDPGEPPARWRMLLLLAAAELLGMSLWFTAGAVSPQLRALWSLSASDAGWLTTVVQLGFVAGTATAAVLNIADVIPARVYFPASAVLAAVANAALAWAPGYESALAARFATGFFLAGVYPPALKMASTWFRAGRGFALGAIVGALTAGKAAPFLLHALHGADYRLVILTASGGAMTAAVIVAIAYRDGPYHFARRPFSWSLVGTVLRSREMRLATGGYLGHMWELYACWTWLAAFLAASAAVRASSGEAALSARGIDLVTFAAIASGAVGCLWGGWAADRIGRERLVTRAMAASGTCALVIGLSLGGPSWLVGAIALAWGFFVIADSGQFSALVTESVPAHAVGTALTLQTSLGFLLTMVTIQLVPVAVTLVGWRWAFALLALGPAVGIAFIARLRAARGVAGVAPRVRN